MRRWVVILIITLAVIQQISIIGYYMHQDEKDQHPIIAALFPDDFYDKIKDMFPTELPINIPSN